MRANAVRCRALLAVLAMAGLLVAPRPSPAHPLGNFSISQYTAIRIEPAAVVLGYAIDMAEIPTFQEMQETGLVAQADHPGLPAYLARRVEALQHGLVLELDGRRLPLRAEASEVSFPPGAGGLPTLKLAAIYRAPLTLDAMGGAHHLRYRDTNFPGRAGWKEIVATGGEGVSLLRSSAPEHDRSSQLASYPSDLMNSPPQDLEAHIVFARSVPSSAVAAAAPPAALLPGGIGDVGAAATTVHRAAPRPPTPRDAFTALLVSRPASLGFVALALAVAAGLGALHALEPGHGKTVVAAYLVGSRGTAGHALLLGGFVTATHTVGVYLLGLALLLASRYVVPERLYPWLGVLSGSTVFLLGCWLLVRRAAGGGDHAHDHPHGSPQRHHHAGRAHHHRHSPHPHRHAATGVGLRELLAFGVTGGMVPCPAALVVLLSAMSLGRVGFGLLLIMAFSAGLAAVLVAIGILMVYARRCLWRLGGEGALLKRWLPLTSAVVIGVFGLVIVLQALASAGMLPMRP
jgi:ABC-type nickel/cobalt efflux system permease component RcnA